MKILKAFAIVELEDKTIRQVDIDSGIIMEAIVKDAFNRNNGTIEIIENELHLTKKIVEID